MPSRPSLRIAVLDDYQGVATELGDWDSLDADEVRFFTERLPDEATATDALAPYDVIVAMRERTAFTGQLLGQLPALHLLVTTGPANAAIDLAAAAELGVTVCGTRALWTSTPELAWGLILSLVRHIPREDANLRAGGRWQTTIGTDLAGRCLGVLGLGNTGRQVAAVGRAFGMEVIAWSPNLTPMLAQTYHVRHVTKEELFRESDVLSIHLVLTDRTKGLVAAGDLALMKPTAYLINTSRGAIVDEDALVDVVQTGGIAGAGLDVFDEEPLPPEHPLRALVNTVLTPHLGYVTRDGYRVFFADAIEDIVAFHQGTPVHVLTARGS
jgi:phosphoglycerate dehydrogenase-like enzyme